ncbi:hypothetical protein GCM10027186_38080 [Micromonospora schwarzwaldensis]
MEVVEGRHSVLPDGRDVTDRFVDTARHPGYGSAPRQPEEKLTTPPILRDGLPARETENLPHAVSRMAGFITGAAGRLRAWRRDSAVRWPAATHGTGAVIRLRCSTHSPRR